MRIDKWLWHTRLVKSRALAARLCEAGMVGCRGADVPRPALIVKPGDEVTLTHAGWRRRLRVLAFGTRRGPAAEARLLYEEIAAPERVTAADPDWENLIAL